MSAGQWFSGEVAGGDDADAFLAHARELAPEALGSLVEPGGTAAFPVGCLITIDVPGIPPSEWPVHAHQLQVMYDHEWLGGYWGCSHLWDDWDPKDSEALLVNEELVPLEAAARGIDWLVSQLRRPLVRQEWNRRWLRKGRTRWVLSDTGRVVAGHRRVPKRWRMPDRYAEL